MHVKPAHEPRGSLGRAVSRFQEHEATIFPNYFANIFKPQIRLTFRLLLVGFMPTVKIRPTKRIKTEGEDATFYCFPGGKGLPGTTWSRQNGKPLSSRAVVSGKILFISRVRKEDEGTYECTARNAYGFDTATSQLTVKG